MKHCPTCQTQFGGQEAYCPHDGTRLVDEAAHQPGHLAGSSLNGVVNLEGFLFADHLGERYRARLLSNNDQVRVTVFHRRFDAERVARARNTSDELERPLPSHLLSIHSVHADSGPVFVVEEWPEGDPLSRILKKKNELHWQQALILTIKVARVLNWMADAEIPHRAVHPRSLFIDELDAGAIQFGEWFHGLLTFPLPDIDDDTPSAAIPVYPSFIAPEWLSDGDVDLHRAAVYSSGAVLYAALGQPIDGDENGDGGLKDLAKASGDPQAIELPDGAPEAITALAKAMVAPSPSKRFEAPTAAIAALASILDDSASTIAPQLKPRSAAAFDEPEPSEQPSAPSQEDDVVDEEDSGARKTQIGLPAQGADDDEDDAAHGPRVIIDDDALSPEEDDAIPGQGPATSETSSSDDDASDDETTAADDDGDGKRDSSRTLLMGAQSPIDELESSDADTADDDDSVDEDSESDGEDSESDGEDSESDGEDDSEQSDVATAGDTIINYSLDDAKADAAADDDDVTAEDDDTDDEPDTDDESEPDTDNESEAETDDETETDDESDTDDEPEAGDESEAGDEPEAGDESESEADTDDKPETDDEPEADTEDKPEAGDESKDDDTEDKPEADDESEDDDEPEDDTEDKPEADDESEDDDEPEDDEGLAIGFVEAQQTTDDGVSGAFFSRSSEDAWEQEVVRESYEQSERMEKLTRWGMIVGGLVILVGAVVVFQGVYEPEDDTTDEDASDYAWGGDELDEEELAFEIQRFEDTLERGDILTPADASAEDQLADLRRHLDEDTYWELREQFIDGADRVSRELEEEGEIRQAFLLARAADEYARGDDELLERFEQLHDDYQEHRRQQAQEAAAAQSDADEDDEAFGELLDEASQALSDHDYESAATGFSEILEEDPEHLTATRGLADTYFSEGSYEQALEYQQKVVELAPDNIDDLNQLGLIYFRSDHYEEAIEQWEKVLDLDDNNREAERYIEMADRHL